MIIEGCDCGATGARVGCMPNKLLIAAAEAAHAIGKSPGFSIHVDGVIHIDGCEVTDRSRRERDRFGDFVLRDVWQQGESGSIRGRVAVGFDSDFLRLRTW